MYFITYSPYYSKQFIEEAGYFLYKIILITG